MPKLALEAKCELNGIESVGFPKEYGFHLKIMCCNCGEVAPKPIVVSTEDSVEGIRGGSVSVKLTCKLCGRSNDLKLLSVFDYDKDAAPNYKKIVVMECRGIEPTELLLADDVPMVIKSETGLELEDAFIADGEFYGYDEKAKTEVSVTEFETRVVKV